MLSKTVDGIIKLRDRPVEFVSILRNEISFAPFNNSIMRIRFIRGRKRKLLSKSGKGAETAFIPVSNCTAYPGGLEGAIKTPERLIVFIGILDLIEPEVANDAATVFDELLKVEQERDQLKKEKKEVEEELKKLKDRAALTAK